MKENFKKVVAFILKSESRLVLWKYKPKIVAITGTVGKTSTKDAIYAVLSKFYFVRKSEKSYNSEIGLPLTILGVPNGWSDPLIWIKNIFKGLWLFIWPHKYPSFLVLEVGVGKPGDMKRTASWLRTDAVIMTMIGPMPAHIEFFDSREHLIQEKSALIHTLKKEGILILNADDEAVLEMQAKSKKRSITYGFQNTADIAGSGEQIYYGETNEPKGTIFRVDHEGNSLPVFIEGVFGKNHIYAALAALAFAYNEKLNMITAVNALKDYDFPPGRMRLLSGFNGAMIIDDTYNSSPLASEAALTTLSELKTMNKAGRKMAVLGDMLELGRHTNEMHKKIGQLVKEKADILVITGPRAKFFKEGALEAGMPEKNIFEFLNSGEVGEFLKGFIKKGDVILVKGSQGTRMERAVEAILLNPDKKSELLVRQDEEWLQKP
jgi:UDP-N-acetylmuramoyl-tripeptide--D-alanyl-D-alanine ligase